MADSLLQQAEPAGLDGRSPSQPQAAGQPLPERFVFRISAMDVATEETEIRHALSGLAASRGLRFLLAGAGFWRSKLRNTALSLRAAPRSRVLGFQPGADQRPITGPVRRPDPRRNGRPVNSSALGKFLPAGDYGRAAAFCHFPHSGHELLEGGKCDCRNIALAGFSVFRKGWPALRQGPAFNIMH